MDDVSAFHVLHHLQVFGTTLAVWIQTALAFGRQQHSTHEE
jgi:hypothetical protein